MQSDLLQGGANYSLPQFKCPHSKITPISQGHHVFSCFTTTHASSMGFGNTEASDEMARTYYFAITVFSVPDIIFIDIPKKPPRGIITSIMMFLATFSIIFTLTFSAYLKLLWSRRKSKCKPKRRRRRKRSIEAIKRRQHEKSMRKKAKANQFISICANNFVRSEQGAVILASEGVHDINPFFDADGDLFFDCRSTFFEGASIKSLYKCTGTSTWNKCRVPNEESVGGSTTHGFLTSLADGDLETL